MKPDWLTCHCEHPWGAEGAAANHDRGADRPLHGDPVVMAADVTVAGHRDADGGHDLGDDVPPARGC